MSRLVKNMLFPLLLIVIVSCGQRTAPPSSAKLDTSQEEVKNAVVLYLSNVKKISLGKLETEFSDYQITGDKATVKMKMGIPGEKESIYLTYTLKKSDTQWVVLKSEGKGHGHMTTTSTPAKNSPTTLPGKTPSSQPSPTTAPKTSHLSFESVQRGMRV